MLLFIKSPLTGKNLTFEDVSPNETIQQIKERIARQWITATDDSVVLLLPHGGPVLNPDATLRNCGIGVETYNNNNDDEAVAVLHFFQRAEKSHVRVVEAVHESHCFISISASDTVGDIKKRIRAKLPLQRLFVGKIQEKCVELTNDDQCVQYYCDVHNSRTTFYALGAGELLVFVKTLSGPVGCCICKLSSDTMQTVKQWVESQLGLPVLEQRLVFNGAELEDNASLADIPLLSTLLLVQMRSSYCPQVSFAPRDVPSADDSLKSRGRT